MHQQDQSQQEETPFQTLGEDEHMHQEKPQILISGNYQPISSNCTSSKTGQTTQKFS